MSARLFFWWLVGMTAIAVAAGTEAFRWAFEFRFQWEEFAIGSVFAALAVGLALVANEVRK